MLPESEAPDLPTIPWVVEDNTPEVEGTEKYLLDKQGFLIYSEVISKLVDYGREGARQTNYYKSAIQDCENARISHGD